MVDTINSYEQHRWERAVSEHARMKTWVERYSNYPKMLDHAKDRIKKLESEYPQLTKPL